MFHNRSEKTLLNWEGRFHDVSDEAEFQLTQEKQIVNRTRVVSLLTMIAYATGYMSDIAVFSDDYSRNIMFLVRSLSILIALICFGVTFIRNSDLRLKVIPLSTCFYFIMLIISECTELFLRPELSGQVIPFLAFVTIVYYAVFPVRLIYQITCGALAFVFYNITLVNSPGFISDVFIMVNVVFLLINVLGIYVVYSMNVSSRLEYLAKIEMITLNSKLQVEIDERKKASLRLVEMASTDELTGVYNRRFFISIAKAEIERMVQSDLESSLLFFDVDYFKHVNDTYGHRAGDEVLKQITKSISSSIREVDILGRIGGEEFAVLLPGCALENAKNKAQSICDLIAGLKYRFPAVDTGEERDFSTTISIGVASCQPGKCEGFDTIMRYADIALYQAKEDGRNRVVVWHI